MCSTGEDDCIEHALCNHEGPGLHSCTCTQPGYSGDGTVGGNGCTDTDGCAEYPCFVNVACADAAAPSTGRTCVACPAGYAGDGVTCVDADGCATSPCYDGVACADVAAPSSGYTCAACPAGRTGDGEICDADPCSNGGCYQIVDSANAARRMAIVRVGESATLSSQAAYNSVCARFGYTAYSTSRMNNPWCTFNGGAFPAMVTSCNMGNFNHLGFQFMEDVPHLDYVA